MVSDLTLVFTLESLIGHLSYTLLVISMMMRRMVLLRIFVTASSLTYLIYSVFVMHDPVVIFWETALILINIVQIGLIVLQDWRARFTPEEKALLLTHFPGLAGGYQRIVLDAGSWHDVPQGTTLTTEGAPVPALSYLARGEAVATVGGHTVGLCHAGSLVGEVTVATGAPATASVETTTPARLWAVEATRLRSLAERRPEIGSAVEAACFRAVRDKLLHKNSELSHENVERVRASAPTGAVPPALDPSFT